MNVAVYMASAVLTVLGVGSIFAGWLTVLSYDEMKTIVLGGERIVSLPANLVGLGFMAVGISLIVVAGMILRIRATSTKDTVTYSG